MSSEVEQVTRETVKNGGVLAVLSFDIHAKTKELVQELGAGFVNGLLQRPGVAFALGEIDEPVGGEEGKNWSTSIIVKILTKNFITLATICLDHSPFNVEILRPDEIKLELSQTHELLTMLSVTTADYKKFIYTKLATQEELAQMQEHLKIKAELGKKILEKKEGDNK